MRSAPRPTDEELEKGILLFLDQLAQALRATPDDVALDGDAAKHGADLLRMGFSIAQVVHDYGDVCQTITELALEQDAPITTDEFRRLNKCLDDAIAGAVTEYQRLRERSRDHEETERLGYLAHELRNKINAVLLAHGMLKEGLVGLGGSTAAVLEGGHVALRVLATKDRVTFEVEDECGSLPSSNHEDLFMPWTRRSIDKKGLGLGLPLTRRSVQANGGEVNVRNLPGKGCVFGIRMVRPATLKRTTA